MTKNKSNDRSHGRALAHAIATFGAALGISIPASARSAMDTLPEQAIPSERSPVQFAQFKGGAGINQQKIGAGAVQAKQSKGDAFVAKQGKSEALQAKQSKDGAFLGKQSKAAVVQAKQEKGGYLAKERQSAVSQAKLGKSGAFIGKQGKTGAIQAKQVKGGASDVKKGNSEVVQAKQRKSSVPR